VQPDIPGPGRMRDGLQHAPQGAVDAAHAGIGVTVASARHGHVDGEYQCGHPRGAGAFESVLHEAAVLEHIQLKPHRPGQGRGDFLDRADRYRRQREWNTFRVGRPGRLDFTAPREHPAQTDRCQRGRHGQGLAKQLSLQAQCRHVAQDPLAQRDTGQVLDVVP
jgi:hypothetical protein